MFLSVLVSNNSPNSAANVLGGNTRFVDCRFVGNQVNGNGNAGGALFMNAGHVELTNVTFESNTAKDGSFGGAVAVIGGSLVGTGCRFVCNSVLGAGHFGGAMAVQGTGHVELTEATFDSNTGGAVAVWSGSLTGRRCLFVGNAVGGAEGSGGALILKLGHAELTNTTFKGNTAADGSVGAVAVHGGSLSLSNTAFDQNAANIGGAVWWQTDNWLVLCELAANCTFSNNYATAAGGALFVSDVNTNPPGCIQLAAHSMPLYNNTADGYGDGIASSPFSVQIISGQSILASKAISIYPAQPVSFVVSVQDALGHTCVQSPAIDLAVSTWPQVPLIWAHNSKLNATGFATIAGSDAIRVLQTTQAPFMMTFAAATTTASNISVQFCPVSCPVG